MLFILLYCFFIGTVTPEFYTLSLHDALPICIWGCATSAGGAGWRRGFRRPSRTSGPISAARTRTRSDRKSTRLNSSHRTISYAVFCLKKKKELSKITDKRKVLTISAPDLTTP